jgi:hypothetical protein
MQNDVTPPQPSGDQQQNTVPMQPVQPQTVEPGSTTPVQMAQQPTPGGRPSRKKWLLLAVVALLLLALAFGFWIFGNRAAAPTPTSTAQTPSTSNTATASVLELDTAKNYGDKYADGVLPVGDSKYTSSGAKQGYVYVCQGYAQNLAADSGGAGRRGPWFSSDGTTYNINKKSQVKGSVAWQASFSNKVSGSTRTIITNDLPNHTTGVYPIAASDPAYAYDKNPNSISSQNFTYSLAASPAYGTPNCLGGQVGVMLTGVAIFNGFDAGGRDAGAWEVQDSCGGHPEKSGTYHYHTLSSCIKDTSVKTVIGFALDGFPITGPKVGPGSILTTSDLDECHGITSQITLDGKQVTTYHYVMTQDFPYSASCFRATAIQPPGQQGPATRQHQ